MPISDDVVLGARVRIAHPALVNLFGCEIGEDSLIGPFVEVQRGAVIGARCKVESHSFICAGVNIGDEVFVGHGVMFTNDRWPRAANEAGQPMQTGEWELIPTYVEDGASIGSGAVILPGVRIGMSSMVGAGAVVTTDVPPSAVVVGCPARVVRVVGPASESDTTRRW